MNSKKDTDNYPFEQPFSFTSWMRGWIRSIRIVLQSNVRLVVVVMLFGAILGLLYSIYKPVRYNAEITFSVEDSKSIGGGFLSSLGGSLGMDISSIAGSGNSVLSGDNVLSLLKSKSMMAQCLKTPYGDSTKQYAIADKYADVYGLREKWKGDKKIGRLVYFGKQDANTRLQDSLLKIIIKRIEEKELSIIKPDKKLNFFNIAVTTKDEMMSLLITQRLIKIATDFYVNAKVGRLKSNISRLEKRTDSISRILNHQTYTATEDARLLLNVNPADVNAPVYSEISQRDKMVLTTIYAELMKNLEVSKAALIQETPTIQIVDQTGFPLECIEVKWYQGIFFGAFLSFFGILVYLLAKLDTFV